MGDDEIVDELAEERAAAQALINNVIYSLNRIA